MKTTWPIKFLLIFISVLQWQCKKVNTNCPPNDYIANLAYETPVWHPDGTWLAFNYSPIASAFKAGTPPCLGDFNTIYPDSIGFYLMKIGGTGFIRITNYYLTDPAWSPDGNWLAFSLDAQIYKMKFTGNGFDTTNMIRLTDSAKNFSPSWTPNGDTIFYDSNKDAPPGTGFYSIWKMSSNGLGVTRVTESANVGDNQTPFVGSDNRVYFFQWVSGFTQIFSIKEDGTDKKQLTNITDWDLNEYPKYFSGEVFYWSQGYIFSTSVTNYNPKKILKCEEETDYDISRQGVIVCTLGGFSILDKRYGTFWIANANGTDTTQLTFNHY